MFRKCTALRHNIVLTESLCFPPCSLYKTSLHHTQTLPSLACSADEPTVACTSSLDIHPLCLRGAEYGLENSGFVPYKASGDFRLAGCRKNGYSKGFKVAILALFLTDFWTLNFNLIYRTLGMAGFPRSVTHEQCQPRFPPTNSAKSPAPSRRSTHSVYYDQGAGAQSS